MDFDEEARLDAARDLAPKSHGGSGQLVTLTAKRSGERDPQTGTTPVIVTTQTGSGMTEAYKARDIDGTTIKAGDKRLMLAALRFNPDGSLIEPLEPVTDLQTNDVATLADGDWKILAVEALDPAGLAIFYNLHLRR